MRKFLIFFLIISCSTIPTSANAKTRIVVFAASSLIEPFSELGKRFEKKNPGNVVIFSFESSSILATQIVNGAKADIFVSASPEDMLKVDKGFDYIKNRVVLAIPTKSKITRISDLNGDVDWIQCSHEVPCGRAADSALRVEKITASPVSLEPNVKSGVSKLLMGEVDAAIIYNSDVVTNSKKLKAIEFGDRKSASTQYKIVQLRNSKIITKLFSYLNSPESLKFLDKKGFDSK